MAGFDLMSLFSGGPTQSPVDLWLKQLMEQSGGLQMPGTMSPNSGKPSTPGMTGVPTTPRPLDPGYVDPGRPSPMTVGPKNVLGHQMGGMGTPDPRRSAAHGMLSMVFGGGGDGRGSGGQRNPWSGM